MAGRLIELKRIIPFDELTEVFKRIEFRGLYNKDGEKIKPYKKAQFSLVKVYPAKELGHSPTIKTGSVYAPLFSPQPTIYLNQLNIISTVDEALAKDNKRVHKLQYGIEYDWKDRGTFHMIPPIIEKHSYELNKGFIDLNKLKKLFNNFYVKDANDNLHHIADRYLKDFYIDEVSAIKHLDIFHSNTPLINYGLQYNKKQDFYIVCDGMHRIDYALEHLNEPITAILVEGKNASPLIPYYAFPMPFYPTTRLSSKQSEKMYPRLERDKIHLFSDFLKKTLHYDWAPAGLIVSKLRSNAEIF
ncbi:MAG: hypothetical protein HYS51_01905 [Candidatus Zambryskibacteria bacterium]|nr:hypothetical protein [Candidatus Zambryskibacteria bacterium]